MDILKLKSLYVATSGDIQSGEDLHRLHHGSLTLGKTSPKLPASVLTGGKSVAMGVFPPCDC